MTINSVTKNLKLKEMGMFQNSSTILILQNVLCSKYTKQQQRLKESIWESFLWQTEASQGKLQVSREGCGGTETMAKRTRGGKVSRHLSRRGAMHILNRLGLISTHCPILASTGRSTQSGGRLAEHTESKKCIPHSAVSPMPRIYH